MLNKCVHIKMNLSFVAQGIMWKTWPIELLGLRRRFFWKKILWKCTKISQNYKNTSNLKLPRSMLWFDANDSVATGEEIQKVAHTQCGTLELSTCCQATVDRN